MTAGIWIPEHDADGMIKSVHIVVQPCANAPDLEAKQEARLKDGWTPWSHGLADSIWDEGATLLCRACSKERGAREARERRFRALPPWAQAWLAQQGLDDWPVRAEPSAGGAGR